MPPLVARGEMRSLVTRATAFLRYTSTTKHVAEIAPVHDARGGAKPERPGVVDGRSAALYH